MDEFFYGYIAELCTHFAPKKHHYKVIGGDLMKNSDVKLVYRILDGDDSAFSELVKKYQKPVHALVWRKIGDFHIAEEITQDTFLKAYQRLSTLKKPHRFTSWLYMIAANNCRMWLRKNRLRTQPLEETDNARLEEATYSGYIIEENEANNSGNKTRSCEKTARKTSGERSDGHHVALFWRDVGRGDWYVLRGVREYD